MQMLGMSQIVMQRLVTEWLRHDSIWEATASLAGVTFQRHFHCRRFTCIYGWLMFIQPVFGMTNDEWYGPARLSTMPHASACCQTAAS